MLNPKVIHSKTGEAVPLDSVATVEDILACSANIAALCMCIVELTKERKLWLEPSKEMVQAGLAEVQRWLDEHVETQSERDNGAGETYHGFINPELTTDDDASDLAVFVLQAMAGKRNG